MDTLAALHITGLKLRADLRKIRLPASSAFHALIRAKSPVMARSRIKFCPSNVCRGLISPISAGLPDLSYFITTFPSSISVPTAVDV